MDLKQTYMLDRYEQMLVYPKEELERRWALARQVMEEQGADLLLVLEGSFEGYNHWFAGSREFECIIIPKAGDVIAVLTGEINREEPYRKERPVQYGKLFYQKPLADLHPQLKYVHDFDARDIRAALAGTQATASGSDTGNRPAAAGGSDTGNRPAAASGSDIRNQPVETSGSDTENRPAAASGGSGTAIRNLRIAMIHPEVLKQSMYENMREVLGEFTYFDIGIPLDEVRVVKSDVERELIRQTNVMNETLMSAAAQVIREGRTVKDVTDEMQYMAMNLGSGGHFVHVFCCHVGPQDEPDIDTMGRLPFPGYTLRHNDKVFMLIETNGPGGHYSALGRFFILGRASEETKTYWNMAVAAQHNAARLMKPGVSVRQIADENYRYITEDCGFLTNHQNYLHSLGFQYGEQPYLNAPSEHTPLREGMHYIAHPVIRRTYPGTDAEDGYFALDTYYVTKDGGIRANSFPQVIIEL